MRHAQLPFDEELRLAALESYGILDTAPEKEFDDLAELLQHITGCAYVTISFIDRERQWHKASIGVSSQVSERALSFCTHAILQKDMMLVPDAREDERFAANPSVTGQLRIRFYAGIPILSGNGQNIGTVCVFDSVLHTSFSEQQKRAIGIISQQVTSLLELRLRNRQIREKPAAMIDMERRTVQYTIREQEKERRSIGFELHENFAQVVAACMMYLNMADEENSTSHHFITKAKSELSSMVLKMRKLSKTFNPVNVPFINMEEMVHEFILQLKEETRLPIRFSWKGTLPDVTDNTALNLFRIIGQYLHALGMEKDIRSVHVSITAGPWLQLTIMHDGSAARFSNLRRNIAFNALVTRIQLCKGLFELKKVPGELHSFSVQLPLTA